MSESFPLRALRRQLFATGGGEGVDTYSLAVLGDSPLGRDPLSLRQSVERRLERARLDAQQVVRVGADHLREAIAVARPPAQGLEDDEVERTLEQLEPRLCRVLDHHDRRDADCLHSRM